MTFRIVGSPTLLAVFAASVLTLSACASSTSAGGSSAVAVTVSTVNSSPIAGAGVASGTATASPAMPMPASPAGPHKQADVTFAQQMIVHHQGAITMSDLAATRASSPRVKALALQIKSAQAPEIKEMSGWLAAWVPATDMNGMPNPTSTSAGATGGMAGMGHDGTGTAGAMPGMMTDHQMAQLTASTGAAFDKMFLQLMIVHHQGALTMSATEKAEGGNPAALALADSILTSQTAQIKLMQDMLKTM